MGALNTDTVVPNLCVCFHKINLLVDSKYDQYNSALKKNAYLQFALYFVNNWIIISI